MENVHNPHDRLFKEFMSELEVAKAFLRHYVPADLISMIDGDGMEIFKDSFIEEDLKEYYSDILYKVMFQGRDGYVYFLFEHKSYPDKYAAFQLLRYQVDIWRLSIKQKRISGKNDFPVIIPILIYHGSDNWTGKNDFSHLFGDVSPALLTYIPNFSFIVHDLSMYSDHEIKGNVLLRILLFLFKYVYHPDFQKKLPFIMSILRELLEKETGMQYLETVMRYIFSTSKITIDELKIIVQNSLSAEKGEVVMTTAEKLINEGFQKGIVEAIEMGLSIKFGIRGLKLLPDITKITDVAKLKAIKEIVKTANEVSEIEAMI